MSRSSGRSAPPTGASSPAVSEERYQLLFHQAPVGVLYYDRELVIHDCNESLCRILQSSYDRLVGLDMGLLRDQRVVPALRAALEARQGLYEGPYEATTSSAQIWVSMRTVPFHGPAGEVEGGIGIVEDITSRHRAEEVKSAIYELSEAAHTSRNLQTLFRAIQAILDRLMPADNVYVALHDPKEDTITFPYFVDQFDSPPPPLKARKGLTEYVLKTGEALLATRSALEALAAGGEVEVAGAMPASWLGVPLFANREAIGVLALQSYDPTVTFGEENKSVLTFVAEHVAMAIERKRHEAQIQRMAYFDGLTGLHNRRMLQERADQSMALAERHGWHVALLYLDLDRFKNVNDTLGHDAGDELLIMIAGELERVLRRSDTLARLGGDEFAFVLNDASTVEGEQMARRILEILDHPFEVKGQRVHIGCSVGIATYPKHGRSLEELLQHADIAMYRAKHEGSGVSVFDSERSPYSRRRLELEADLRQAVDERRLRLHYQPLLDLDTDEVVMLEALARWPIEDRLVEASQFVPLAEESDLIRHLDWLVLCEVVREAASWPLGPRIAVNLSARSLHHEGLVQHLANLLSGHAIPPHHLIIEVTESAAMRAPEVSYAVLHDLAALGVEIAIDDFGSGYASLTYLRRIPCHYVKIDKSLVQELGRSRRSEPLVEAALSLGHGLGLQVVGEGVETVAQIDWLRARKCDLAQGYLVGRPQPLANWIHAP